MARKRKPLRLTPGELEILAMLWEEGPLTLSEAHARYGRYGRAVSYPTMQTRLNRLAAKGVLHRSDQRPAVYRAVVGAQSVGADHLDHWLRTTRQPTVAPLVAHLISEHPLTEQEIVQLKRLLADAEQSQRKRAPKDTEP